MNDLNAIGLDTLKSKELAYQLNDLLSNYSIFYQNARGYHWNIKGDVSLYYIKNLKSYTIISF